MQVGARGQPVFAKKTGPRRSCLRRREEDSQLDVLLRPGLLADVEIIVEKIPNAIHVPAQAVFEKDGKQIVYVRKTDRRFEERVGQARHGAVNRPW